MVNSQKSSTNFHGSISQEGFFYILIIPSNALWIILVYFLGLTSLNLMAFETELWTLELNEI